MTLESGLLCVSHCYICPLQMSSILGNWSDEVMFTWREMKKTITARVNSCKIH